MAFEKKNGTEYKLWILLEKKMTGKASLQDLAELEVLCAANAETRYIVQTVAELRQKRVGKLTGDAVDEGGGITPMAELSKPEYLADIIDEAVNKGASIINHF
ncbi:hypothetical protein [Mucilaginibacter sp.]|uniref:hypothetical protein n=1 Tax=Mucilaginibacter sp. TaxID=1882438 RepID=UPI002634B0B7|nr:hypothetical protein [Mucilaginibacter sp.]MDB4922075.1 hypothetical protein [Mucilaginibacter sp.]